MVSVVNNITARRSGVAIGEREIHLAGNPVLTDRIGGFEFEISANSFFQTNTRGAQKLYETVGRYAALKGHESGAGPILRHRNHRHLPGQAGR